MYLSSIFHLYEYFALTMVCHLCFSITRQLRRSTRQAGSLTNDDLDAVITEIKQLWPDCRMVRGSPRHSESNGGVERVNRTVQAKLGAWMQETRSRKWSVGCRLIMWRYNTQHHRTVDDIPYRLLTGQLPRVGISNLLLDSALIDRLATEAQLNRVVEYEGMLPTIDTDDELDVRDGLEAALDVDNDDDAPDDDAPGSGW